MQHLRLPSNELKELFNENDKEKMYVYLYLNFNAVYKEQTLKIKNRTINLKVGQLATSIRFLSENLKIDFMKIRRILDSLKKQGFITITNLSECSIICILSKTSQKHDLTHLTETNTTSYSSSRHTHDTPLCKGSDTPSDTLNYKQNQQVIESVDTPSDTPLCKGSDTSDRSLLANTVLIARKKEKKEELERKIDSNASASNNKGLVIGVEVLEAAEALSSNSLKDDLKDKKISLKSSQERALKNKGFSSVIDFNWISDIKEQRLAAEA